MTKDKIKPSEPKFKVGDKAYYFKFGENSAITAIVEIEEFLGNIIDGSGQGTQSYRVFSNYQAPTFIFQHELLTKEEAQAKFNEWINESN